MGLSWARAETRTELFFPVEKNGVQVLPQRFEYQLLNKDQFRVGNILINAKQIDFQILPSSGPNRYKLRFQWPVGLLNQGEIVIKDNSGKGIWFQKIQAHQVALSEDQTLATYETETEVPSLIRAIQLYPFFRFCVHREEPLNKTYLCSKDLFLRRPKDQITIEKHDSYRPQSYVEINGRTVGDQGMIFLNSPSEFISLRALLLSGATLEIDTRMKKINFKDVLLSPDGKQIIVRAQGSEPADPSNVEHDPKAPSDEWQIRLDTQRPFTYVKGEGDLPLRQEFLIQGPVRKEDVKVTVTQGGSDQIFQDEVTLTLQPATGLKLLPADKKTKLDSLGENQYKWTLTGLKKNEVNRRYIKVSSSDGEYFAAYDLKRSAAFDGSLRLMAPLWAEANLLYTPRVNWGFDLQFDMPLQKSDSDPDLKITTVGAQYRFSPGLHLQDSVLAAEAYLQSFRADSTSLLLYGLALQAEYKNPRFWGGRFPWTFLKIRLPLGLDNADYKIQSSYEAELTLRSLLTTNQYWEIGARTQDFNLESGSASLRSQKSFGLLGYGWIF